jgi:hypothetical protein
MHVSGQWTIHCDQSVLSELSAKLAKILLLHSHQEGKILSVESMTVSEQIIQQNPEISSYTECRKSASTTRMWRVS